MKIKLLRRGFERLGWILVMGVLVVLGLADEPAVPSQGIPGRDRAGLAVAGGRRLRECELQSLTPGAGKTESCTAPASRWV